MIMMLPLCHAVDTERVKKRDRKKTKLDAVQHKNQLQKLGQKFAMLRTI